MSTGCAATTEDEEGVETTSDALETLPTESCSNKSFGRRKFLAEVRLLVTPTDVVGYEIRYSGLREEDGTFVSSDSPFEELTTPDHYAWTSPHDPPENGRWIMRRFPAVSRATSSINIRARFQEPEAKFIVGPKLGDYCDLRLNGRTDY